MAYLLHPFLRAPRHRLRASTSRPVRVRAAGEAGQKDNILVRARRAARGGRILLPRMRTALCITIMLASMATEARGTRCEQSESCGGGLEHARQPATDAPELAGRPPQNRASRRREDVARPQLLRGRGVKGDAPAVGGWAAVSPATAAPLPAPLPGAPPAPPPGRGPWPKPGPPRAPRDFSTAVLSPRRPQQAGLHASGAT